MQRPYCTVSLIFNVVSFIMWVVAFATRGWLTITDFTTGQKGWLGLFTADLGGIIIDEPTDSNPFFTTIILQSIGGFLALAAFIGLVLAIIRNIRQAAVVFIGCGVLSGLFRFASVIYFAIDAINVLTSLNYSWYLALFSAIFTFSSVTFFGVAVKRRELELQNFSRIH